MQNIDGWEALAEWYDKKQGETGDLWHRSLIDPVLIRLVGDVAGKDVLDLGCGNGYLSRRFAKLGGRLTSVDSSEAMLKCAKRYDPENHLRGADWAHRHSLVSIGGCGALFLASNLFGES